MKGKTQKGFTLLEMLVVVSIIGILVAVLITNVQSARVRARDAARKFDMRQIKSALRLYYNDYQQYPTDSGGNIVGCGASGTSICSWGGDFSAGAAGDQTIYMKLLPLDPINDGTHVFSYNQVSQDEFTLMTELENPADPDIARSQSQCGAGTGEQYVVCED